MEYKGYIGSVEFSESNQILFGKVQGIRSLISYEGTTASELIQDFRSAVDDYLELCAEEEKLCFLIRNFFRHTPIIARYKYPISISRISSAIIHHTQPI